MPINVAALLLALYEPVKLAEDLAVVDLISRGRVSYIVGIGYRAEEFAMFGVDRRQRAALVEERITLLRRLWSEEEVEIDGRRVRVTPQPYTQAARPWPTAAGRRQRRAEQRVRSALHGRDARRHTRTGLPRRRGYIGAGLLLPPGRRSDHRVRRRRSRAGLGRDRRVPPSGLRQLRRVERTPGGNSVDLPCSRASWRWPPRRVRTRSSRLTRRGRSSPAGAARPAAARRRPATGSGLALPRGRRGGGRPAGVLAVLRLALVPGGRRGGREVADLRVGQAVVE